MQLAILVVLILILIVLAPWLLGLVALAAVAYGAWFVATGVLLFILTIVFSAYFSRKVNRPSVSSNVQKTIERVNAEHRRKEAAAAEKEHSSSVEVFPPRARKLAVCRSCSAEIQKHSMFCPVCGKSPV